jgi:hypothetical protein
MIDNSLELLGFITISVFSANSADIRFFKWQAVAPFTRLPLQSIYVVLKQVAFKDGRTRITYHCPVDCQT